MPVSSMSALESKLEDLRRRRDMAHDKDEFDYYRRLYVNTERDYGYFGELISPWISAPSLVEKNAEEEKQKAIAAQQAKSAEFANKPLPEFAEVESIDKFLAAIIEREAAYVPTVSSRKRLNSEAAFCGWVRPKDNEE